MAHSKAPATHTSRLGVPLPFLLVFSCIWLAVTGLATTLMLKGVWGQYQARSRFVAVPAVLTTSAIKEHDGEDGTTYSNDVVYVYTYQGQEHRGERIAFDSMSGSYRGAKRWQREHPAGSSITAYIDPQEPGTAVLRTQTGRSSWMMMLFLLPFQAVAVGCIMAICAALRDRLFPESAQHPLRGLIVREDPDATTLRLESVSAIGAGVATTGLLAFLSTFVVGMTSGMSPSPTVAISTICGCIGLGIFASFWRLWRVHGGQVDVTIDRRHGVVLFPPSAKSVEVDVSRPIALKSVRGVRIREVLPAQSSESSSPGLSALDVVIGHGPAMSSKTGTITLHQALASDQARRIAAYLRGQFGLQPIPEPVPEEPGDGGATLADAA